MANPKHTHGPGCRLAPIRYPTRDDDMPPTCVQFFYSSLVPIDDPLSTGYAASASDSRSSKRPLRPFSNEDNIALERAWLGLASPRDRQRHQAFTSDHDTVPPAPETASVDREKLIQTLALDHWDKHHFTHPPRDPSQAVTRGSFTPCCTELLLSISEKLQRSFCSLSRKHRPELSIEDVAQSVVAAMTAMRKPAANNSSELVPPTLGASKGLGGKENEPPHRTHEESSDAKRRPRSGSQLTGSSSRTSTPSGARAPFRIPHGDDGISGRPFVRVGSLDSQAPLGSTSVPRSDALSVDIPSAKRNDDAPASRAGSPAFLEHLENSNAAVPRTNDVPEVAVGVSRLHKVSLPLLQMKPIYWSPVNDIAVVTRATWFYRDTMLPVAPAVANQMEAGYHELRPWTETWSDEVRCAIDVGPLGEEKVSHLLWAQDSNQPYWTKQGIDPEASVSSDPFCAARCFQGEAACQGSIEPIISGPAVSAGPSNRPFANYHVIYKDEKHAFLLKPSLKPSAYYGRRPMSKIVRGLTVGIPVIRGFDRRAWDGLHEKPRPPRGQAAVSAAAEVTEATSSSTCVACKASNDGNRVTDLILVAHGIGQKFAERVESFHFTHAINGFRRAANLEMSNPLVQQVVRKDQNGPMILPLNWRSGLSFEDGGPVREEDEAARAADSFALKDIEPGTIPAVRSMMSDVMFDIPFYMSHHKSKMIEALVSEANRVYRLWCRNNPGFADKGRVHLIAHSLGSAMALDILSHQPTKAPQLDLSRHEPESKFFEFDTCNLFLLGSPAGFFLLLEHGALVPRRGQRKPGADPDDSTAKSVVGDRGTFGCLAVDNIYNILAKEDPIAYLLNGAVDSAYASGLKTAYVPSTTTSILKSVGDAVRNVVPGMAPAPETLALEADRPPVVRLPSQLELEVHDFTREEIAEKKFLLLNDNGQIDWFLRSGGGPLEIQYLNMLSAHTSYWTNLDFIRMLCIEIGRKPGRAYTVPVLRAAKAGKRFATAS
ncbi:DDHD domain-containingprotein [Purpureocillium lavendulum]|uniref:DDHD domain-containingprotein n=1 Tax=Purpureocillium lavendulum TaxID=1247861 RepID=A0AB34FMX8_9HYPO|nr:DDHD domain-containingprotein [Purpureocillium lavendulum]